jgi:hypothetical protein
VTFILPSAFASRINLYCPGVSTISEEIGRTARRIAGIVKSRKIRRTAVPLAAGGAGDSAARLLGSQGGAGELCSAGTGGGSAGREGGRGGGLPAARKDERREARGVD